MAKLIAENLSKEYPTRGVPLCVLRDVNLALESGESLAILGPSGSGKSTLLSILATLEAPTAGRVVLDGDEPATFDPVRLARFRNRRVGLIFQEHCLLPQCSALENVLLPTIAERSAQPAAVARARSLLERVALGDRLEHRPAELSGGERQRVAIARALMNQPTLLLADEPTGNLDRTTADRVAELLLELHAQEQTLLIVVTHSQRLAERMKRRLRLDDGVLKEVA